MDLKPAFLKRSIALLIVGTISMVFVLISYYSRIDNSSIGTIDTLPFQIPAETFVSICVEYNNPNTPFPIINGMGDGYTQSTKGIVTFIPMPDNTLEVFYQAFTSDSWEYIGSFKPNPPVGIPHTFQDTLDMYFTEYTLTCATILHPPDYMNTYWHRHPSDLLQLLVPLTMTCFWAGVGLTVGYFMIIHHFKKSTNQNQD